MKQYVKLFEDFILEKLSFKDACKQAQDISKKEGVVQHVNELPNGTYKISDWYDEDLTIASFENGRRLNEMKVEDDELKTQIEEFAKLSNEIDEITKSLNEMKKRYSFLEDQLRPVLEELKDTKDISLEVNNIIVTIKRRGYSSSNYKYKDAFEWLYERVNPQMKNLVDQAKEANKSISNVVSKIGVQYKNVNEGIKDTILSKLKSLWSSLISKLKTGNKNLSKIVKDFKV